MDEDIQLPADVADLERLAGTIECLLFVAGEPLAVRELTRTTEADEESVHAAIRFLRDRYVSSGLQIVEIAHGFQMATRPTFAAAVGKLMAPNANKLSRPALETVTIIAYRQPCTQAEIEAVRGVASDGVLKTLMERDLIRDAGRKPTPGRPILYATTDAFLHYFGLAELSDLPLLDEDEAETRADAFAADQAAARVALTAAGLEE
jgi:segregation and condensation protein B